MRTPSPAALPTDPGAYGPAGRSAWLDVDWRAHRRFVAVDGRWVNVVGLGGDGDPDRLAVVFVHGLSGSWQNWLENLPHFAAAGHRVIAFDLPGFGQSQMPRETISIAGYARFVDALLERLGVGPAIVVGNSMGGFIGAELAIRFPARVERLVLVSAAGLTVEYQRNERVLGALRFAENALTDYPIRDRLRRIGCPTLIVWGEEDHLIPVRDATEFAHLIPGARKVVWPKTGHMAMLERPAAFNALVDAFIAEGPGERVRADAARAATRGRRSRRAPERA